MSRQSEPWRFPVVGVFSSALILGEPLTSADLVALALVVTGLFIVLVLPSLLPRRLEQA